MGDLSRSSSSLTIASSCSGWLFYWVGGAPFYRHWKPFLLTSSILGEVPLTFPHGFPTNACRGKNGVLGYFLRC
ncbi:unnamed protein product [Prunus armeniaca]